MLNTKSLGIVFANMHDSNLGEMTEIRSMSSLPFGGRYRLIDFYLSSLVAAGVTKVGVIAKNNYHSLMDHLGSGRPWDLSRKRDGLSIFPPHSLSQEDYYHGRVEALHNIIDYIRNSAANYVVMMDCDHVCNLDVEEIINYHIATKADVTVVCRTRLDGNDTTSDSVAVKCDEHGRVKELLFDAFEKDCVESMNVFIVARDKLVNLIEQAQSRRKIYFERDVLLSQLGKLHVQSYMFKGFCRRVFDTKSYFSANMALLDPCNMHALFVPERPVYTKVRDDAPVRYGLNAKVKNSLIADGCVVLGDVENCLLFRGVTVGEDAVLRNSIVMQDTIIGENSDLSYIITDKNVTVGASRSLMGHENYPLYIKKLSNI